MTLEGDKKQRVSWRLDEPVVHFWLFFTTLTCLAIVLFLTRGPATFTEGLPRGFRDFLGFLGIVAAPVGSLSLLFWMFVLWSDWSSRRSLPALLLLLAIVGLWSSLVLVGLRQSSESAWRWAKYGAIAGAVVGLWGSGSKDRFQRTETYDRKTGKPLSVTPWSYVASIPFVPTLAIFLFLALLGAIIGAAAFGASVLLKIWS